MFQNWSLVVPREGESHFVHDDHEDGPRRCSWVFGWVFCNCGAQFFLSVPVDKLPIVNVVADEAHDTTNLIDTSALMSQAA